MDIGLEYGFQCGHCNFHRYSCVLYSWKVKTSFPANPGMAINISLGIHVCPFVFLFMEETNFVSFKPRHGQGWNLCGGLYNGLILVSQWFKYVAEN